MSRKNKVNPDHYKVAGRLSPDDLARERLRQSAPKTARTSDEPAGRPTWMYGRAADTGETAAAKPSATKRTAGDARAAKSGAATRAKKPAKKPGAGTRKKPVPPRSAAGKLTRNAATVKSKRTSVGGKKASRR